jgi:pilus assembly protein Flp/PilA
MRALVHLIRTAFRDSRGATAIEYGLIVALIVIAMIASLSGVADATIGMWSNVNNKVATASQ